MLRRSWGGVRSRPPASLLPRRRLRRIPVQDAGRGEGMCQAPRERRLQVGRSSGFSRLGGSVLGDLGGSVLGAAALGRQALAQKSPPRADDGVPCLSSLPTKRPSEITSIGVM